MGPAGEVLCIIGRATARVTHPHENPNQKSAAVYRAADFFLFAL